MIEVPMQTQTEERLHALCMQLGLTLWRLQELEGVVAKYYVLVALATRGMGIKEGQALQQTVDGKTFGKTVRLLRDANKIPDEVVERLPSIVHERNWLVHSSLADERAAVYNDVQCEAFTARMKAMTSEASSIIKIIAKSAENFVLEAGVSQQEIERLTKQTLDSWRGD